MHFLYFVFSPGLDRTLEDHKILLLEAAPDKPQNISSSYSNRVSSITPGSKKLLESKMVLESKRFLTLVFISMKTISSHSKEEVKKLNDHDSDSGDVIRFV